MRLNRGLLFWGLAFATAGAVALAVRQGVIPSGWFVDAWRLWPLILIAIGLAIIFARTAFALLGLVIGALLLGSFAGALLASGPGVIANCGTGTGTGTDGTTGTATQQRDGTFGGSANIDLTVSCGTLNITTHDGNDWSLQTRSQREGSPQIDSGADSLSVTTSTSGLFGIDTGRQQWDLTLPTDPALDLSIDANAAHSRLDLANARLSSLDLDVNAGQLKLDLGGATVDGLDLELNAGSASVVLDDQSKVSGSLSTNAGSIDLCAPASLGLRIELDDNVAFGDNLDESGLLERDDDIWQSPNYESAATRATLNVSGNAGSFELNPKEGCA